jgi:hypothetical protein
MIMLGLQAAEPSVELMCVTSYLHEGITRRPRLCIGLNLSYPELAAVFRWMKCEFLTAIAITTVLSLWM